VLDRMGAVPRVGDCVRVSPFQVTVLRMDGIRVERVRIEREDC
jgi:CBS domain containing-hemolysin-like protein